MYNHSSKFDISEKQKALKIIDDIGGNLIDSFSTRIEHIESGEIKEIITSVLSTFAFSILFIFLILSAQFESFLSSTLILTVVPFSIVGGILSLIIFNDSLNLFSGVGLIALIGLIIKNSIMIIEFANQLIESEKTVYDAVTEASKLRLKPILMTSISTISGAVPLIFTSGVLRECCRSIGLEICGGMIIGTVFTIFIVPVLYHACKRDKKPTAI